MENTDKVIEFLRQNKRRWYCDRCISQSTGVKPSNQVSQICRPLGAAGSRFARLPKQRCAGCAKLWICTKAFT
jgi:hypothetical protein